MIRLGVGSGLGFNYYIVFQRNHACPLRHDLGHAVRVRVRGRVRVGVRVRVRVRFTLRFRVGARVTVNFRVVVGSNFLRQCLLDLLNVDLHGR